MPRAPDRAKPSRRLHVISVAFTVESLAFLSTKVKDPRVQYSVAMAGGLIHTPIKLTMLGWRKLAKSVASLQRSARMGLEAVRAVSMLSSPLMKTLTATMVWFHVAAYTLPNEPTR